MSLVDAKGRLFGKVNLIDAVVAATAAGLVPVLVFTLSVFSRPTVRNANLARPATIGLDLTIFPEEMNEPSVEIGESLYDKQGRVIGTVTALEHTAIPGEATPDRVEVPHAPVQMMSAVLDAQVRGREALLGGVALRREAELVVRTSKGGVTGRIKQIYLTPPYWLVLAVRFPGVIPEVASVIQAGDAQFDESGKTIARVRRVLGYQRASGELELELEIHTSEEGRQFFFYDGDLRSPVKIGSLWNFRALHYDVNGGRIIAMRALHEHVSNSARLE